jgi:thioredoxin 1
MSKHVREVNERDFDQVVLKSKAPVLVDFWAEWCGPCHALAPDVEATAERYRDGGQVVKVNVDDSPTLAQRYRIQAIPTLILFQDGVEKERIVGVAGQEQISETIERYIRADLATASFRRKA